MSRPVRYFASVCADPDCTHTYNWHTPGQRCTVRHCQCELFLDESERKTAKQQVAQVAAEHGWVGGEEDDRSLTIFRKDDLRVVVRWTADDRVADYELTQGTVLLGWASSIHQNKRRDLIMELELKR